MTKKELEHKIKELELRMDFLENFLENGNYYKRQIPPQYPPYQNPPYTLC